MTVYPCVSHLRTPLGRAAPRGSPKQLAAVAGRQCGVRRAALGQGNRSSDLPEQMGAVPCGYVTIRSAQWPWPVYVNGRFAKFGSGSGCLEAAMPDRHSAQPLRSLGLSSVDTLPLGSHWIPSHA
jgi:hypothetical protein